MALFDSKVFNAEVFAKYVDLEKTKRNELIKSGAIVEKPQYASLLPDQVGGNYITLPIKDTIGGTPDNYDGSTDISSDSRGTFSHGRIVVGRAHGWTERDFSSDITGEDFLPAVAEVAEYWDEVDQDTLLATLKGIFSMTGKGNVDFVNKHTYDVTGAEDAEEQKFGATTLNTAIQKALGDNKGKFSLAIMHSAVATHLENLNILQFAKYTDKDGIERQTDLGYINGKLVLIDDDMPLSADGKYTTYVLGQGAIEYTNVGAKVPYELARNAAKNGGEDTIYSRQRKVFSPYGISFKNTGIMSPTNSQLETGSNWELAHNMKEDDAQKFFPEKQIAIARIITKG